jgi:hypothetical protein
MGEGAKGLEELMHFIFHGAHAVHENPNFFWMVLKTIFFIIITVLCIALSWWVLNLILTATATVIDVISFFISRFLDRIFPGRLIIKPAVLKPQKVLTPEELKKQAILDKKIRLFSYVGLALICIVVAGFFINALIIRFAH